MPPEIVLLLLDISSRKVTLWKPVVVACMVLDALHYYAICTIFFGRLLGQCAPDMTGPLLVVWLHTLHASHGKLVH